jgi:HK97 gp10 family phage protein
MSFDTREIDRFMKDLWDLGYEAERGVRKAVRTTLEEIADLQRDAAPVGATGDTRDTIGIELAPYGLDGRAGTETWYAHFLEGGTQTAAPQPFIFPAGDQREGAFLRRLGEAVTRW